MIRLATMFGIGHARVAPGTCGSLAAALLAYPVLLLPLGWLMLMGGVVMLTVLGTRASNAYMTQYAGAHDPSAIVIDEWAGQWATYSVWHAWLLVMAGSADAAAHVLGDIAASPMHLAFGFVLFRFFDIMKPWPIRWADRRIKGGFGVMFDDLLAALAAGTLLFAIHFFGPLISGTMMESQV